MPESEICLEIRKTLFSHQDIPYRVFQSKLIPTATLPVIGVRTPVLRRMAKALVHHPEIEQFLSALPHAYFEENNLHGFILSELREYDHVLAELARFLPYVDNWATCDQTSPRIFRKNRVQLIEQIPRWLASPHCYTVRFGIVMLLQHYLDDAFSPAYPEWIAALPAGEYYIDMAAAWYFATALAKQYDAVLPFFLDARLHHWVHNKAIQKARESLRIPAEQKDYLNTLKRKTK